MNEAKKTFKQLESEQKFRSPLIMKRKLYVAIVNDFTTYQKHKLLIEILFSSDSSWFILSPN